MAAKRQSRKSRHKRQALKKPTHAKITKTKRVKAIKKPQYIKIKKQKNRSPAQLYSAAKKLGFFKKSRRKNPTPREKKKIELIRDVLEGRAVALPISPKSAKSRRLAGYRVINNKIILPLQKGVTYKTGRGKTIIETRRIKFGKIKIILTPYSYADLQQGLDILQHDPEIQKYLSEGWRLALRFKTDIRNYYSHKTLQNIPELRDYLERYDSLTAQTFPTNLDLLMVVLTKKDLQHQNVFEEQRFASYRKRHPSRSKSAYNARAYQSRKRRDPGFMARKRKASREYMRKVRKSKRRNRRTKK